MNPTLRLGRVAGVPVGVHWSALLIVALIAMILGTAVLPVSAPGLAPQLYWVAAAVTSPVFFASLLAHELAHALVARRAGVSVKSITLWLLGGVTEFEGEVGSPRAELRISLAGPVTSAVVALAALAVSAAARGVPLVWSALVWLATVNGVLAVFNMLPGAPLDGGRVLHAVLWRRFGDRGRADRVAARAGQSLGMALIAAGVVQTLVWSPVGGLWTALVGWFLSGSARGEGMARAAQAGLEGLSVREVMTAGVDQAPAWLEVGAFAESVALRSAQSVFPVVDFSGAPVGTVSLAALCAVPVERRGEVRVSQVMRPLPAGRVLQAQDPAAGVLSAGGGEVAAVVCEGGRVVGMVTAADVARIMLQASLRAGTKVPGRPG
ncbi:site-2 protease family protein [Streptosporangium sp. NPDC048047]|uniref:site-2 protease family protein n=1 Tax=Streptosporangium sp. NPDC048047 TaxID=3155748 RepID=UPI003419ECC6